MKDYIDKNISKELKVGVLFADFILETINRKAKRMGEKYKSNYKTLIFHLNNFSKDNDSIIYTNSVNEEFLDDFIIYLEGRNLKQNYIKNLLGLIKNMARKAGSYGYIVDCTYDDVSLNSEEYSNIYLTTNEITRIYYFKGLSKKKERIKDLFVIGCLTALRYSDYSTLTKENFVNNFIVKKTKKTGKNVVIPIHEYIKEIYEKYDGEISSGLCLQHFNRYIKSICKQIGFADSISHTYTRGGKIITDTKPKYEFVSSHTARRSAATNMYLTGRMKTYEIMSLTGHTTEKSFFRYIRVDQLDIVNKIASDSYFKI